ncbi:MAG: hypothetical protein GC162_11675 [Planctomycetes bacterium]|nr:hypothetical protein [Planctomycetota bacterium]
MKAFSSMLVVLTVVAAAALSFVPAFAEAPEPDVVPSSWELGFKYHTPAVISVRLPGEDKPRLYWYMTYTVTNGTGEDQLFVPDAVLLTDAGDLMQANRSVPPTVFKAIKSHLDNPLLESPTQIIGKLLQGPDNAKDGVFIWELPNHDVDHLTFFIGGLSGETHEVKDEATGDVHLLRKTLMVEYQSPGDESHAEIKPFIKKGQDWVVR